MTILFVTLDQTVRADCSSGGEPRLLNLETFEGGEDLAMSVETALLSGDPTGKQLYIVSTEVWTQVLQVPARAIRGLTDSQLLASLANEAEAVSGIDLGQSELAYRTLGTAGADQNFWVSQISTFQLERLEQVVRERKSRLAGVCHPTGLAALASGTPTVELWPGVIAGHDRDHVQILAMDPTYNTWQTVLEPWLANVDPETLSYRAASPQLMTSHDTQRDWQLLSVDANLESWLLTVARALSKAPDVPVIQARKKPISSRQLNTITAIACGLTILACAAHFIWLDLSIRDLSTQAGQSREISSQITKAERELSELQRKQSLLQTKVRELTVSQELIHSTQKAHRLRWSRLLEVLPRFTPRHLVIQRIDHDKDEVKLSGLCLEPQLANQLAAGLTEHLTPYGWQVHPPQKKALERLRNGGPWSYEIVLENSAIDTSVIEQSLATQEASP